MLDAETYKVFYIEYKGLYFACMYNIEIQSYAHLSYRLDNMLGKDNYKVHTSTSNVPEIVEYTSPFKAYNYFYNLKKLSELHTSLSILQRGINPSKKQFEDYCKELNSDHIIQVTINTENASAIIYLPYKYTSADFISVHTIASNMITYQTTLYTRFLSEVLGKEAIVNASISIDDNKISVHVLPKHSH